MKNSAKIHDSKRKVFTPIKKLGVLYAQYKNKKSRRPHMILTSLLNLIEFNLDAVYTFLCKICDESCSELSFEEARVLDKNLNLFNKSEKKDFSHFIKLFEPYKNLQDKLIDLGPDGHYGFLTNEENIETSCLDGISLILISDYISIFGSDCVKVLVPHGGYGCHH